MTRSVADQFVDTLVACGVKRIFGVVGDSLGIEIGSCDIETRAWMDEVADNQTNEERERGDNLEIEQRLATHAANFFQVLHAGDA